MRAEFGAARSLVLWHVQKILAVIPDTVAGRWDRTIVLTLVLTGRRRSEVFNLTAGNITVEGEVAFYSYRGKGGKRGRRELPRPAFVALLVTLSDAGKSRATMHPELVRLGRPGSVSSAKVVISDRGLRRLFRCTTATIQIHARDPGSPATTRTRAISARVE